MNEKLAIDYWYLNVRWNKTVNGYLEEELLDLPIELIEQIDTYLDLVEHQRNKEKQNENI
jgi:hypothetical protein